MAKILFSREAQKQYRKLPSNIQPRVARAIAMLALDPRSGKKLVGTLRGMSTIRAWPYRVIYTMDVGRRSVIIIKIQHRQGVYTGY